MTNEGYTDNSTYIGVITTRVDSQGNFFTFQGMVFSITNPAMWHISNYQPHNIPHLPQKNEKNEAGAF